MRKFSMLGRATLALTPLLCLGIPIANALPTQSGSRTIEKPSNLSARDFEAWTEKQSEKASTTNIAPHVLEETLISRLKLEKFTTDAAISLTVGAWTYFELNHKPEHQSQNDKTSDTLFPNTLRMINLLKTYTYGRPQLAAQLDQQEAGLYALANDNIKTAKSYEDAVAILTPLQQSIQTRRLESLTNQADALYALGNLKRAEDLYLTVLSDDNYFLVEDPKTAQTMQGYYVSAGRGLIAARSGNYTALKNTFFVPSAMDELQPYLNAAIADAKRRSGKSNGSSHL